MEMRIKTSLHAAALTMAIVACAFVAIKPVIAREAVAAAAQDSPTAESVMAASVKAMGGKEAIDKIKTMRCTMEMMAPGPAGEMKVELESLWSRSGGRIARTKMPMGEMEMGTDGKTTWKKGLMGAGTLSATEKDQLDEQASMIMNILEPERTVKEQMTKIEHTGRAPFEGKDCHRLHFVSEDGEEGDFYYDATTGLPLGIEGVEKLGDREMKSKVLLADWKEVEGVQVFHSMTMETSAQPGQKMSMKVTKVEINSLEDSDFAPPAGAKPAAPGTTPPATGPAPRGTGAGGGASGGDGSAAAEVKFEDLTPEQQQDAQKTLDALKKSGNLQAMKMAVGPIESSLAQMPEPRRKTMQYVVQELKKEIARLGG